ncbi:MAG TPA: tetratricopeptide repeat protein, partial [Nitrospirota bacterium]|nr:tetratricopeptide repeat protein [Nitrospirota bacterium]
AALLIRMNLWEESLGYLQNSIQLNDHYVPALINLGIVHARNGNSSEAERALLKALSLEEQNHSALFNIAVLYENEGSYDKARGYYQKLQTLGESEGIRGMKRLESK